MRKILIIEDETVISDIIKYNLEKEGFSTIVADDGLTGLEKARKEDPDLILLDLMLPKMDGFEVCRKIRETSSVPIIMVTAKEEELDKVLGLELGADDYITKPFSIRELIARVRANIRRSDIIVKQTDVEKGSLVFGNLVINLDRYEATKNNVQLELTLREFELLKYLAEREGRVFSREQLLQEVWDYEYYGDIRTVDVTVRRLREKLEDDSAKPKFIITKRGIGYYFRKP